MLTEEARKIAVEAKRRGMWLYDPVYRKWYSPEDFQHVFHYAPATDELLQRLQIRHPAEGVQAGFQRLGEIHNKLQQFAKMVLEYYKK